MMKFHDVSKTITISLFFLFDLVIFKKILFQTLLFYIANIFNITTRSVYLALEMKVNKVKCFLEERQRGNPTDLHYPKYLPYNLVELKYSTLKMWLYTNNISFSKEKADILINLPVFHSLRN